MRLTLGQKLDPAAQSERDFTQALVDHIRRTAARWVPAERDRMIAALEATLTSSRARADAKVEAQRSTVDEGSIAALRDADRHIFAQAADAKQAGRVKDAWSIATPLFKAYPDVFAVQDLRCQLAMALGGAWDTVQAECEPLLRLTPGALGKKK
jgi:hypothetical protein